MATLAQNILNKRYLDRQNVGDLSKTFVRDGYVKLPNLLTPAAWASVTADAERVSCEGTARDFEMPGYATPRKMRAIGGKIIRSKSPVLMSLYGNHQLADLMGAISMESIYPCRHPSEFMVMNVFEQEGATHGWHFDDPAIALIVILSAPPARLGGLLEYVAPESDVSQKAQIPASGSLENFLEAARSRGVVRSMHHVSRDAYLLRADRCLHRVTPIEEGAYRAILNLAYEITPNTTYGDTADLLYDDDVKSRAA